MGSAKPENTETELQGVKRGRLESLLGFQLRRAQIKLFQHFESAMADLSVTPGQAGVLILIEANPGISQAALARAMEVERATLGETISKLRGRQLVERRKSPRDGRSLALHLSARGRQLMTKLHAAIAIHERDVSKNLADRERRDLKRLLVKFNRD